MKYVSCFGYCIPHSFEDLKMGLKFMRSSARTRSEGPIAFVKTNLGAILDCMDSLNGEF